MNATTSATSPARRPGAMHENWLGALIMGLFLLPVALWGITVQVATSEAMYLGQSVVGFGFNFDILLQPLGLFNGGVKGIVAQAYTYAWGVEVVQFLFSSGLVVSTLKHNRVAGWICIIGCIVVMVIDSVADYRFGHASNDWQRFGFSLVVFMMAFGVAYYTLDLIVHRGIIGALRHFFNF